MTNGTHVRAARDITCAALRITAAFLAAILMTNAKCCVLTVGRFTSAIALSYADLIRELRRGEAGY